MEKYYQKLGYVLLLLIPLMFIGFYPTYFKYFPNFKDSINSLTHLHTIISIIWVAILIIQPFLILNKKYKWHKILGKSTYVIFPVWILSFIPMMLLIIEKKLYKNLVFPIADIIILIILYVLAIKHKKTPAKHMRYMIASALVLIDPTVGRLAFYILNLGPLSMPFAYTLMNGILLLLIWIDYKNKKNYTPYLIALILFMTYNAFYFLVFYIY